MKHTCDRTVPCHFQVQTRLWLWRRWFELVFELLASHAPWIWAWIWPMPRVNISKKCENHGFLRKIIYKWCVFQIWVFRRVLCCDDRKKLLMKEMTTRHCVTAICINLQDPSTFEPRLIQPPDCYSIWKDSPQPRPKTLQEHGKTPFSFSTFRQKYPHHSATTSSVGQQGSRPRKDLPRSVELFFDAASPAQAYVKLCETICHFPRHCIALEVTWRAFFPGDVCSGTQNLPWCLFDGENASIRVCPTHFWWVNLLLLYHYIPLDPGWNSLFLCDFVHETFLWSRYLECSPISAVQHTEWRHTFFNWLWFCFTLNARAVFQETRGKLILTGTQFCRRSLKCLGPGNSWSTVGTGAHRCASCLPVNGLHIAKNRSFQILHLQGVSKIQNWHAPAISRGLMTQMQCMILSTNFSKSIADV